MFKKFKLLKWILLGLGSIVLILFLFGYWFMSLIPPKEENLETTQVKELPYVSENIPLFRGKILAVVTSTNKMGSSGKNTGYELTELARAYYVFQANGFEVDIASPQGGNPPVVIDDDDMGAFDFAFLNDTTAQTKVKNSIAIQKVNVDAYEAVYFVGGKGAMFDFPNNKAIQNIIRNYNQSNKVIGAVCHGPAALVNVTLDNGHAFLKGKTVSGFTNKEELLLIPEAASIFPFLLQDQLVASGASFNEGEMYLQKVSHDSNLVTGQNPWSVWIVAETMITQLGYNPKLREITDEENAIKVLTVFNKEGTASAKKMIEKMLKDEKRAINRTLIAQHSLVAAMKGDIGQFFEIIGLVSFTKKMKEAN